MAHDLHARAPVAAMTLKPALSAATRTCSKRAFQHGFVRQMPVGDQPELAVAVQRGRRDLDEAPADVRPLATRQRMERRVADDDVVLLRQAGGDVVPVEAQGHALGVRHQVLLGQRQRALLGLEQIQRSDARAARQQRIGQEAPAGAQIGRAAAQVGRQRIGQQLRGRIDPVPGEHARAAAEPPAEDRPDPVQRLPFGQQRRIVRALQRRAPEHAAMVLGQRAAQPGQPRQILLHGLGALVVGHARHHPPAGRAAQHRLRQQRARFFLLARGQEQDQRCRCDGRVFGLDLEPVALQRVEHRLEGLRTPQRQPKAAQGRAGARAQEEGLAGLAGEAVRAQSVREGLERKIRGRQGGSGGSSTGRHFRSNTPVGTEGRPLELPPSHLGDLA